MKLPDLLLHAGMLNTTGNASAALALLKGALPEHPNNPELLAALGVLSDAVGSPINALNYLHQALAFEPNDLHILTNIAFITGREKPHDGVLVYQNLLLHHPDDLPAHANLGSLLLDLDRPEEAKLVLEQGMAIDPRVPVLRYNLARAYSLLGNSSIARSHYEEAARLAPDWELPKEALAEG